MNPEINKCHTQRRTITEVQSYCLQITHTALETIYGNYSDKCLQSSVGLHRVLKHLGISSKIVNGACCFITTKGSTPISWGGFWDKDHHVWLITEFFEIVDLTVSQLHLHPSKNNGELDPIPALWWQPADYTPSIFKYLPDSIVSENVLTEFSEDQTLLENFLDYIDQLLLESNTNFYSFNIPVIDGPETLNKLYEHGNEWARGACLSNDSPMPIWVRNRELELIQNGKSL